MDTEQQGWLLDRLASGMCAYYGCAVRGSVWRRLGFVVKSVSLQVALRHGPSRLVMLDMKVCSFHAGGGR